MEIYYLNKEKRCHSRFENRYAYFRMLVMNIGESFVQSDGKELVVCFIRTGSVMVKQFDKGTKNQVFTGGSIIFFSKSSIMHIEALEDTNIILVACNIPHPSAYSLAWEYLSREYKKLNQSIDKNKPSLSISKNMSSYLKSLETYFLKKNDYKNDDAYLEYIHQIKEEEMYNVFQMEYSARELIGFFPGKISQENHFQAIILSNYKSCKTVKELREKIGCSNNTFQKLFKEIFKKTPIDWLNEHRCKSIMEDLTSSDYCRIKDLVFKYNFSSPSHFTFYCIKHFGMSPSEIRKRTLAKKKTKD